MGRLLKDNKGQVSIELIVVMAVLLGASMFLMTNLTKTVEEAGGTLSTKTTEVLGKVSELGN